MSERAAPAYCPYCGDEDLRPEEGSHRRWSCRGCRRVFEVSFVGLLAFGGSAPVGAARNGSASGESASGESASGESASGESASGASERDE